MFDNEASSKATIYNWFEEFSCDHKNLNDDFSEGQPRGAVTREHIDAVRKLINSDHHVTYNEIKTSLNISRTHMHSVSSTIKHVYSLVMCVKTCVYSYESETKKISVWVFLDNPRINKSCSFQRVLPKIIIIAAFFIKSDYIITVPFEFVEQTMLFCIPQFVFQKSLRNYRGLKSKTSHQSPPGQQHKLAHFLANYKLFEVWKNQTDASLPLFTKLT